MNIMFVLSVAILTFNSLVKISLDDRLQHVAKSSHPYHFQGNWKQMTPSLLCFIERTSDFGMIWGFVATFQGSAIFKLTRF